MPALLRLLCRAPPAPARGLVAAARARGRPGAAGRGAAGGERGRAGIGPRLRGVPGAGRARPGRGLGLAADRARGRHDAHDLSLPARRLERRHLARPGRGVRVVVGKDKPVTSYGVLTATARALSDKGRRLVTLDRVTIEKLEFPSVPAAEVERLRGLLASDFARRTRTIALDKLEAALEVAEQAAQTRTAPLRNDPPDLLFSQVPAILVSIDGEPVWRPMPQTGLERASQHARAAAARFAGRDVRARVRRLAGRARPGRPLERRAGDARPREGLEGRARGSPGGPALGPEHAGAGRPSRR